MNKIKNTSIRNKIVLSFFILIVLYWATSALAFLQIGEAKSISTGVEANILVINELQVFGASLEELKRNLDATFTNTFVATEQNKRMLLESVDALNADFEGITFSSKGAQEDFWEKEIKVALSVLREGVNSLTSANVAEVIAEVEHIQLLNRELIQRSFLRIGANLSSTQRILDNGLWQVILTGFGAAFLGIIFSLLLSRTILQPIKKLARVADDIAHGNLDRRSRFASRDELGLLSASLNKMADKLLESHQMPENILRSMQDSLFVIDHQGVITEVNQAALDTLGYTEEELVGAKISRLFANVPAQSEGS